MFAFLAPILPELYINLSDQKFFDIIFKGKKGGVLTDATTAEDVDAYKYMFQNWSESLIFHCFYFQSIFTPIVPYSACRVIKHFHLKL